MVLCLRALAAPADDLSSFPSTHIKSLRERLLQGIWRPLLFFIGISLIW